MTWPSATCRSGTWCCTTAATTRPGTASTTTSSSRRCTWSVPGGLVAVLTSRFTMDARNPAARREIASLADLLGAIRLPGGAHQRAAGTSVITDLLVLRRREPGRPPDAAAWEKTRYAELDGVQVPVNEYFLDHPDAVLGQMGAVHGAYRADDLVVRPDGDTIAALSAALDALISSARQRGLAYLPADRGVRPPRSVMPEAARSAQPDGYLRARPDGTFTRVVFGAEQPHAVPASQAAELGDLLALRDSARALLAAEAASAEDTPEIAGLRAELGRRYDHYLAAYGPLNRFSLRRTGRTDPATGEPVLARIRPRQGGFAADPFAPLVYALEQFDPVGQRAAKAAVFRERVIAPRAPRLGADTPADALAICLDARGEPRLDEIARLLGTTEDDARAQLGTLVFDDPGTGRLVPAAEYLSGQVREKLRQAERAAEDDSRFAVNVTELRRVIPPDLTPGEIDARLGAAWIDATYVQQFLREILDDPRLRVEHPGGQIWAVRGDPHTVLARSTWGTSRYPAPQLAQALLEQRGIEVRDTVTDANGQDRSVLNADATLAAQEKAAELAERFADWAWEDPARAAALARTYNDRFNSLVLRSYDDAQLSLPGLALTFRPRPHQVAAVARMIGEPAVLLAHEVGAGKTAEMIMGVTELRRLGLVRKPAVVVPNHMLEQFAREWLQLYPQAKVMTAGQEDLARDRRREFVARCATGTWDGIVMSRSAFERIPLSAREQQAYMDRELDQMRQWIRAAKSADGITVKKLEGALLRAEERLRAKLDSAKDPGITFEATGIDYLCIDFSSSFVRVGDVVPRCEGDCGVLSGQRVSGTVLMGERGRCGRRDPWWSAGAGGSSSWRSALVRDPGHRHRGGAPARGAVPGPFRGGHPAHVCLSSGRSSALAGGVRAGGGHGRGSVICVVIWGCAAIGSCGAVRGAVAGSAAERERAGGAGGVPEGLLP